MRASFVLREIGKGFKRNATMIIAVIIVTFVSMLISGTALLMQVQASKLKNDWSNKVEVSVWMCMQDGTESSNCAAGSATDDQISAISTLLESKDLSPYIQNVTLQSQNDVFAEFQNAQSENSEFEGITKDSFGPIFRIKLKNPNDYKVIQEMVQGKPGVYSVVDQSAVFGPLFNILNKVQIVALTIALVLFIGAILLISTTIKLSALNRNRETGIMKLVGASKFFIILPFMLEGAIAALIGSLLALGTLWSVLKFWLSKWIQSSFNLFVGKVKPSDVLMISPYLIGVAILLAGISSIITLKKYTNV
jgi:cell division transport system permease protein